MKNKIPKVLSTIIILFYFLSILEITRNPVVSAQDVFLYRPDLQIQRPFGGQWHILQKRPWWRSPKNVLIRASTSTQPSITNLPSTTTLKSTVSPTPQEDPAVTRFRQYLRTNTSHPNPNYDTAITWIKEQAEEIGLEYRKIDFPPPALFTLVLKWEGSSDPSSTGSIMFNSHIDTVAVDPTKWKYDPFGAVKDDQGNIYGRGAQDRKSLGAQYLESVRRLKAAGFTPMRTIYITFVPDEEVGGRKGMGSFLKSPEFKDMNVSLAFDEGAATPSDQYAIFYGERSVFRIKLTATGKSSHTALMLEDNAALKLNKALAYIFTFREEQLNRLKNNPELTSGDVASINLSQMGGGLAPNVVPSEVWAIIDTRLRIGPDWDFSNLTQWLDLICAQTGPGVRYEVIVNLESREESSIKDEDFWWNRIQSTFNELGWKMKPQIFAGATDARLLRKGGVRSAYGFSPLLRTEQLGHQDNEFLNEVTFLDGIKVYEKLIPRLANAM